MRIDLLVPEDKPWAADLPKRYQLRFMNTSPMNEFVFTEGKATAHAFEIAGTIQHEANVSAIIDNEYRKIMQSRNAAYAVPKRTLMPMDEGAKGNATYVSSAPRDNATFATLAQPALSGLSTKKGGQEKRERLPREELLLMLFTAFKKYNYWTLKALIDKTQQPSGWLREVLQDITVLNKRGPYTGMYQLKPEYRDRAADLAKMNPTAAGEAVLAGASGASGPADDSIIGAPGTVAPRR
ncbi:hypothetical protein CAUPRSCDRAFT_8558 [Caulochytrium protostelioides]|nr:hypothetical protein CAUPRSCDRAFT_8558 [Caulochytrium protostelioides]